MQHLEVSGAVRPIYGSLGVKRLIQIWIFVSIIWYDRYLGFNPMLNDQWMQISVTKVYSNSVLLKYTLLDRTVGIWNKHMEVSFVKKELIMLQFSTA